MPSRKYCCHEDHVRPAGHAAQACQGRCCRARPEPDGSYINPNGIDDESFFEDLDDIRASRLKSQARLIPGIAMPKRPVRKPGGKA